MKNIFHFFLLLVTLIILLSCNRTTKLKTDHGQPISYPELENASWIMGTWENTSSNGHSTEIWERKNDSILTAVSFFIVGKDTVSSETISLEQKGRKLFYIPTVKNQNVGKIVKFLLTSSSSRQLVFENPAHDFPQKITYTQITNDSLVAEISGISKGKQQSMKFPMKRAR